MSADNEIDICKFTDCWTVSMQFASDFWDQESLSPDDIRDRMDTAKVFHSEESAQEYADVWECKETIVEYGQGYYEYDYPLIEE